jgi:hypothetical protein
MDAIYYTVYYGFYEVSALLVSKLVFFSNEFKFCSLLIMNKSKKLSAKQQEEIKRRSYTYLSYLLRSPVYDTCTKYDQ